MSVSLCMAVGESVFYMSVYVSVYGCCVSECLFVRVFYMSVSLCMDVGESVFYMSVSLCMSVGESVLYVSESVYGCW